MTEQKIVIEITGESEGDLNEAIDKAVELIKEGFCIGCDENENGSYYFKVEYDKVTK